MNILIIDKEEFLAENLCNFLRLAVNVDVQYTTQYKNTVKLISENKFDLIVTDLQLPDSQGISWLIEIGNMNPGQKLIIISSHQIPEKLQSFDNVKIIAYFEKPFDAKKIVDAIGILLLKGGD